MFKNVIDGHHGKMGMYSLLQQMFGHDVAAKICAAEDVPFPTTRAQFNTRINLLDPFSCRLNDFDASTSIAPDIGEDLPPNIPSFVRDAARPRYVLKRKRAVVISDDDEDDPIAPYKIFPELSPLNNTAAPVLKRVPSPHSPEMSSKRTRLQKGRSVSSQSRPESSTEQNTNQPSSPPSPSAIAPTYPSIPHNPPSISLPTFIHDLIGYPQQSSHLENTSPSSTLGNGPLDKETTERLYIHSSSIQKYFEGM
jgi:hypothetical protein